MSTMIQSPVFSLSFHLFEDAKRTAPTEWEIAELESHTRAFVYGRLVETYGLGQVEDVQMALYPMPNSTATSQYHLVFCAQVSAFFAPRIKLPEPYDLFACLCHADLKQYMIDQVITLKGSPLADACEMMVQPMNVERHVSAMTPPPMLPEPVQEVPTSLTLPTLRTNNIVSG